MLEVLHPRPGGAEEAEGDGHDLLPVDRDVVEADRVARRLQALVGRERGEGRQGLQDVPVSVDDSAHGCACCDRRPDGSSRPTGAGGTRGLASAL